MQYSLRACFLATCVTVCCACWTVRSDAQDPFARYELMMDHDPEFPTSGFVTQIEDGVLELWETALKRDEPALQRMILDSIKIAHRRKVDVSQLNPTVIELLKKKRSIDSRRACCCVHID